MTGLSRWEHILLLEDPITQFKNTLIANGISDILEEEKTLYFFHVSWDDLAQYFVRALVWLEIWYKYWYHIDQIFGD